MSSITAHMQLQSKTDTNPSRKSEKRTPYSASTIAPPNSQTPTTDLFYQ